MGGTEKTHKQCPPLLFLPHVALYVSPFTLFWQIQCGDLEWLL